MRPIPFLAALAALACGCGPGGGAVVRGDFPDSAAAPASVLAVEAGLDAPVAGGAFAVAGLSPGPATLHLVRDGDTVGTVSIHNLPAGAEVSLRRLRTDPASGLAFPGELALRGARLVVVNGLRMGASDAVRGQVDEPGVVLARSAAGDALLLRPDDPELPDLRVVLTPATDVVTADGDPVQLVGLAAGDSVRVQGPAEGGFVMAARLVVPRRLALVVGDTGEEPPPQVQTRSGGGAAAPAPPAPAPRPAVRVRDAVRERPEGGRGRGRDQGRGGGGGKRGKG